MPHPSGQDTIRLVDAIVAERHLLKHPFYQAWTQGRLTTHALREYAKQYWHHVLAEPQYVSAAHARCPELADRQILLENLIEEEHGPDNHPELWLRFAEALGVDRDDVLRSEPLPETWECVSRFRELGERDFVTGIAALYCYESQVPAVSASKIEGLRSFYGIDDARALSFFTVHLGADAGHAQAGRDMLARYAIDDSSRQQAREAADAATTALWRLLDGVYEHYVR